MNQDAFNYHIAAIQASAASKQAISNQARVIWAKARDLYISRYERNAITDFFEWIQSHHERSIWASVLHRDGVSSCTVRGDNTTIHVQSTFRRETDGDDYAFPTSWFHTEDLDAGLSADLDALYAQFEAHEAAQVAQAEVDRRAQFEALKNEFEPTQS